MNFYIGFTKDLKRRLNEHKKGLVTSTENRFPLKLVYYEACLNEHDAIKRKNTLRVALDDGSLRIA